MLNRFVVCAGIGIAATTVIGHAFASVLTVTDPVNFADVYGVNPIGNGVAIGTTGYYTGGSYDSVGATSITPVAGTTVTATQGAVSYNIPYLGGGAFPNQFYRNVPLNPALNGAWTLTVNNAGATNNGLQVTTPILAVTTPPPSVSGLNISGSGLAPTIGWTIPAASTATAEVVYIFNVNPSAPSGGAAFSSAVLPATTTSYTLPVGVLTPGTLYSISVQPEIYSGGGSSGNVEARTRDFTAALAATSTTFSAPVYLPAVSAVPSVFGGPIFDFDVRVSAGTPIILDPAVATGYIYQTGVGDPNFASIELPDIGNPANYELLVWNGAAFVLADASLAPGTLYDFTAGGVSEFEVLGINPSLGLDPNNFSAFMTEVSFVGSGTFTGTMTPVIASVPEPATLSLIAVTFFVLVPLRYRRRVHPMPFRRLACVTRTPSTQPLEPEVH